MKHYIKFCMRIVVIGAITAILTFALSNRHALSNVIHNYTMICVEKEMDWKVSGKDSDYAQEGSKLVFHNIGAYINTVEIDLTMDLAEDETSEVKIYYTDVPTSKFDENNVLIVKVDKSQKKIQFHIGKRVYDLRIDLAQSTNTRLEVEKIIINSRKYAIDSMDCLLWGIMLIGAGVMFHFRKLWMGLYEERELIKTLVHNDLKSRYAGSFFGLVWAFVQPIMTILVFWLVYELGFRTLPVDNVKFILWFIPAYIPWVFFSDAVTNTSSCLREYSYLVKKMKFKVEILPVIKVFTSLVIHFFFVTFMIFIYIFYKFPLSWMTLQLFYYAAALIFLLIGLGWLTSTISVFMKDFTQIISIILQIGFFVIPIFWNDAEMSPKVLLFLKLNPVFYIVQGYRDSLINKICFWDRPILTAYYWLIVLAIFTIGVTLFRKTRKHFADLI